MQANHQCSIALSKESQQQAEPVQGQWIVGLCAALDSHPFGFEHKSNELK